MGDFEHVKEATSLRAYVEAKLERAGGGYVCPTCKSGTGPNHSPAFSIQPNGEKWKCFSCGAGGDVFDLAGIIYGTDDARERLRIVAEFAGVPLGGEAQDGGHWAKDGSGRDHYVYGWGDTIGGDTPQKQAAPDYTEGRNRAAAYIMESRAKLTHPDAVSYLEARGISIEQARAWGFGYDPDAGGAKNEAGEWCRRGRIVIPWKGAPWYYIARSIAPDVAQAKYTKPKAAEVGPQPLYNPEALDAGGIYIVEGVLDALAVEACGHHAIALAGTGARETLTAIASRGYTGHVVILLDSDEAGKNAAEEAERIARAKGLHPYRANLGKWTKCKDPFEAFTAEPDSLKTALIAFREEAKAEAEAEAQEAQDAASETMDESNPAQVAYSIFERRNEPNPTPTGFRSLDRAMNGGLVEGLTILGAVSSAGKTTFLVQVADHIAANGRPVLFVSCEQGAREIVGKSLSRLMAGKGYRDVTLWEMGGKWRDRWPDEKNWALAEAVGEYADAVAPNLTIMEADEPPTVADIRAKAEAIAAAKGAAPCIMVDYIQLLAAKNPRFTDKQAVDANLSDLRRMARDMRAPVVAISSLNRNSYSGDVEMSSFKESGSLEYSADVLLAMQPRNMRKRVEGTTGKLTESQQKYNARNVVEEYRKQNPKESEITVLKNRNGRIPANPIPFTFYAASSLFEEA